MEVAGKQKVPYTKYAEWDYHFTGVPNHLDLSNFSSFKKNDLILMAVGLNNKEIVLNKKF